MVFLPKPTWWIEPWLGIKFPSFTKIRNHRRTLNLTIVIVTTGCNILVDMITIWDPIMLIKFVKYKVSQSEVLIKIVEIVITVDLHVSFLYSQIPYNRIHKDCIYHLIFAEPWIHQYPTAFKIFYSSLTWIICHYPMQILFKVYPDSSIRM